MLQVQSNLFYMGNNEEQEMLIGAELTELFSSASHLNVWPQYITKTCGSAAGKVMPCHHAFTCPTSFVKSRRNEDVLYYRNYHGLSHWD